MIDIAAPMTSMPWIGRTAGVKKPPVRVITSARAAPNANGTAIPAAETASARRR